MLQFLTFQTHSPQRPAIIRKPASRFPDSEQFKRIIDRALLLLLRARVVKDDDEQGERKRTNAREKKVDESSDKRADSHLRYRLYTASDEFRANIAMPTMMANTCCSARAGF